MITIFLLTVILLKFSLVTMFARIIENNNARCRSLDIYGRRYFYPLISEFPTYRGLESSKSENLPVATKMAEQVICLPMHHEITEKDIEKVNNFAAYNCYKELYELNKDKWTKKQYFKRIILLFNFVQYDRDEKYSFKFRVSLFKDAVFHISSIEDVYSIIKFSFSPQFRSKLKTCMKI